jgi:N-acetyl-1-D-myo-inositol-2-amino-2-deoxy-alpha-D-glucopyranoside deacetylase
VSSVDRATLLTLGVAAVFAFAIGAAVGFIATFTHHQYLPWGLVAGLLVVSATVTGFRLVFDSRVIAGAAAAGVVAGIAVLALPGIGGSVLVVDDPVGWIWAVAPVLLSVTVVAWPRRRIETP